MSSPTRPSFSIPSIYNSSNDCCAAFGPALLSFSAAVDMFSDGGIDGDIGFQIDADAVGIDQFSGSTMRIGLVFKKQF